MVPRCDGSASVQSWFKHSNIISVFCKEERLEKHGRGAAELALHLSHKPSGQVFSYLMNNIWPRFCQWHRPHPLGSPGQSMRAGIPPQTSHPLRGKSWWWSAVKILWLQQRRRVKLLVAQTKHKISRHRCLRNTRASTSICVRTFNGIIHSPASEKQPKRHHFPKMSPLY